MSMKVEVHILQNFASSNLNRDDTGAPKDCELGGVRRARVSSQCLKRSIRDAFEKHNLVPEEHRASRTKRLVEQVAAIVAKRKESDLETASKAVAAALAGASLKADPIKQWKTQYLLFVPTRLIQELADVVAEHFDALASNSEPIPTDDGAKVSGKASAKKAKASAKDAVPDDVVKSVSKILADGDRTPELALFGRMIADAPEWNVNAACQVAHAVSTNRVSMEFDFYTAIDDLKKDDSAGSDMMGTVSFNSACFYRYLVVDTTGLKKNLGDDAAATTQARDTLAALLRASVLAIPSGKQNSMAAHNLPSLVLVDVRDGAEPRSLTNAFVDPVRPKQGDAGDLVSQSVDRLGKHLSELDKVYGRTGRKDLSFVLVGGASSDSFAELTGATDRTSLDKLIEASVAAAFGSSA